MARNNGMWQGGGGVGIHDRPLVSENKLLTHPSLAPVKKLTSLQAVVDFGKATSAELVESCPSMLFRRRVYYRMVGEGRA